MAFWSTANITDPKRNHRWLFELGSTNADTNDFFGLTLHTFVKRLAGHPFEV